MYSTVPHCCHTPSDPIARLHYYHFAVPTHLCSAVAVAHLTPPPPPTSIAHNSHDNHVRHDASNNCQHCSQQPYVDPAVANEGQTRKEQGRNIREAHLPNLLVNKLCHAGWPIKAQVSTPNTLLHYATLPTQTLHTPTRTPPSLPLPIPPPSPRLATHLSLYTPTQLRSTIGTISLHNDWKQ